MRELLSVVGRCGTRPFAPYPPKKIEAAESALGMVEYKL
jgi:hypothetical protein